MLTIVHQSDGTAKEDSTDDQSQSDSVGDRPPHLLRSGRIERADPVVDSLAVSHLGPDRPRLVCVLSLFGLVSEVVDVSERVELATGFIPSTTARVERTDERFVKIKRRRGGVRLGTGANEDECEDEGNEGDEEREDCEARTDCAGRTKQRTSGWFVVQRGEDLHWMNQVTSLLALSAMFMPRKCIAVRARHLSAPGYRPDRREEERKDAHQMPTPAMVVAARHNNSQFLQPVVAVRLPRSNKVV